jgi:glycosyltransferase involved in cell wall biosynthesis
LKIAVVIPLWKRPEVTKFCFDKLIEMISKSKHEIKVTCAISEEIYESVCDKYGFDWVQVENFPLGHKINTGIKKALESEFDYLMMMNSDDVIDVRLIDEVYEPFFDKPYFGINKVTYVNFHTKEARDFTYGITCLGIAKMLRRDIVEKAFKRPGYLYKPELNRCLDDTMMDNLIRTQNVFPVLVKYEGQMAWDFKSETNIWSWDHFKNKGKAVCYSHA